MIDFERIRDEVKKLNPIDDIMFRKMAEEKDFCEEILRVILDDRELTIEESEAQWTGTNLLGRSVILDARCVRGDGTQVDIEVQKADDTDHQKRVRYNGAILTTNTTVTGTNFRDIPDVCVVYISAFDIFGSGMPIYHIERIVKETGIRVENGFEEVYVNTKVRDGSDISELMRIFVEDDAYSERFPRTSEYKRRYKEKDGRTAMSDAIWNLIDEAVKEARTAAIEEGRAEGWAEGRAEGREKGLAEGREKGLAEGIAEGEVKGEIKLLLKLIEQGILTADEAARNIDLTEEAFLKKAAKYA